MKSVKKYLFLMAVVAALFGFVACSSDDDGASASEVVTYKSDEDTLIFYDDDTFKVVEDGKTFATGTYTGDVTKNTGPGNTVTATIKKMVMKEGGKLVNIKDYVKAQVKEELGAAADLVPKDTLDALIEKELEDFKDFPVTIEGRILSCWLGSYTKAL